jgi:hypothetical protein
MQTITVHPEPSAVVPGMLAFGPTLYAANTGADHPTPPAPDRGSKAKPKKAKSGKKK